MTPRTEIPGLTLNGKPKEAAPLLRVSGLEKAYGGVRALRGVDMVLARPGQVHALMGENGSGKSTLLGVLSGQVAPDAGTVEVDGRPVVFEAPLAAVRAGIGMVSQETAVALELSVAENVLLGRLPRRRGMIDWGQARRQASRYLRLVGLRCDLSRLVGSLSPDQRQLVEIARALSMQPRVLILDEPTSSLTDDEVDSVLGAIRLLKQHDVASILVSHRLAEIDAVADEVTVLRDGKTVAAGPIRDFDQRGLVSAMVGSDTAVSEVSPVSAPVRHRTGVPALALKRVSTQVCSDVSLEVFPREVVGIAGLVGSGRGEVLRSVYGTAPVLGGTIEVDGTVLMPGGPVAAIEAGIGYVPPERKTDGLVLLMSVGENLAMVQTARHRLSLKRPRRTSFVPDGDMIARLRLRPSALPAPAHMLSGGNQQKVVLAKWLAVKPRVLMLAEATRGVDVRSRGQIHAMLRELAERGSAVLISSSENNELLDVCDRIVVMFGGRIAASLHRSEVDEERLSRLCGGQPDVD